jgi:putative nucleotidyltransferase with HDIG domain
LPFASFDELATGEAAREALERLRAATNQSHGAMERHCLRTRQIAAELASRRGWTVDDEVLTVAAILHDIGLYPTASRGGVYTADGAELARELLASHGWPSERIERCADAIERHHELRSQLRHGEEVEALRNADLVDLSAGWLSYGLDRRWLRTLNTAVPRRGLAAELAIQIAHALRERPLTMLQIFRRP